MINGEVWMELEMGVYFLLLMLVYLLIDGLTCVLLVSILGSISCRIPKSIRAFIFKESSLKKIGFPKTNNRNLKIQTPFEEEIQL